MNRQRFLTFVLLLSLALASGPRIVQGSVTSPPDLTLSTLSLQDASQSWVEEASTPGERSGDGVTPLALQQAPPDYARDKGVTADAGQALPAGVSADWWTTVQEGIRQSEYHITWQDRTYLPDLAAAYQAPNRAHNLRTFFTPAGIRIIPRTDTTPTWEWGLTLTGCGHEGDVQSVASAELVASTNRIEYRRPSTGLRQAQPGNSGQGLIEWYVNDERGLEQGFTLTTPPQSKIQNPKSKIVLELALTGNLPPNLTDDGQAVEFTTPGGVRVLRYSDLHAYDATGRDLPAQMSLIAQHATRNTRRASRITRHASRITVDAVAAVYPITIELLVTSPDDWTARSDQANAYFGGSVGTAGDVNGDGYDDIIIGAPLYDGGQLNEGRVFVWRGGFDGLGPDGTPTNADWWAESNQDGAQFGLSVGTAGDVNGDGYDDVIIGAHQYDDDESNEGRAFVWYGSADGLGDNGTPTNADWKAESNLAGAHFGWSVGTAGDVNGDGHDDIIVGAPYYDDGEMWEGWVFVWYGGAGGLGADGTPANADWTAESNQEQPGEDMADFGSSVGTAGDVNGDGYDDIIVGAYGYESGGTRKGRAFVWHGDVAGLGPDGTPTNADWWAESDRDYGRFGFSVGTAGSVNGDTWDDVIVGASNYSNGETGEGAAFVYHGSATGLSTTANWKAEGNHEGDQFGFSVGTAGDMDGDSYDDVIVGAPGYSNIGSVSFWYGSASGLNPGNPDLFFFNPSLYGSRWGESVGMAGNVDGDGDDDFIIGAPLASGPQPNGGHAYVHYGEAPPNWAFLLYLDGDNNLESWLLDAVDALENAAVNPHLIVLALVDGIPRPGQDPVEDDATWRYHIQPGGNYTDGVNRWSMGERDMGDPQTLIDFVTWARDNYSAKHYYLAVADHGRGTTGIAWDWTSGSGHLITVAELRTALQAVTNDGAAPLDVIHYDACLMAMLENAYQIQDYADYLIASENLGWSVFAYALYGNRVTGETTPEQLTAIVVDEYHNRLSANYPRTISALDLGQAGAMEDAVSALATALRADLNANKYYVGNSLDATQKFDSRHYCVINNEDEYVDLYDFARLIKQNHPGVTVKNAAQGVMDAMNNLVLEERHLSGLVRKCEDEFKHMHYNVYWDLEDAHGVSIYFPPVSGGWGYNDYMSHVSFRFTVDGQWDEFLQDFYGVMGLPPETPVDPGPPPMTLDEPIVGLTATNDSPTPLGSVTTLTATITAGDNVSYTWAFGDGETGSEAVVTYTYPALGVYTAVVTASNSVSILTATTTVDIVAHVYLPLVLCAGP